ncbi:hypothetical protein GY45DRAFT_1322331 [Cubamyces sp. BRFM 1775]|nr:hypothetical protein GY45DRAFT_1322331 [Cubamyces sp. BRFM 1775]
MSRTASLITRLFLMHIRTFAHPSTPFADLSSPSRALLLLNPSCIKALREERHKTACLFASYSSSTSDLKPATQRPCALTLS